MTYPIEGDFDDPGDVAALDGLSWANCPMLRPADMLAVIQERGNVDGRAVNLFRNALH